jgi:hypothetical protein
MVAKTYEDVVTESRVLLQDTDSSSYRYSNTNLIAILNRGLQALARVRPDACYDLYSANSLEVPELVESSPGSDQTIWTANFGLEMQFFNPLLSYTVGLAELVDDEYSEDGRAALLLSAFKAEILGL